MSKFSLFLKTVFFLLIISGFSYSQTSFVQTPISPKNVIRLDFQKIFWHVEDDLEAGTGVLDFNAKIPAFKNKNVIISLPYIRRIPKNGLSSSSVGNFFIGIQHQGIHFKGIQISPAYGIFLPSAESRAAYLGSLTNFYEIWKFLPHTWTLHSNISLHYQSPYWLYFNLEAGPNFLIPSRDDGRKPEICGHAALNIGARLNHVAVFAEYLLYGIFTGKNLDAEERYTRSTGFGISLQNFKVTPTLYYQIYKTRELRDLIDGVLGLRLSLHLD